MGKNDHNRDCADHRWLAMNEKKNRDKQLIELHSGQTAEIDVIDSARVCYDRGVYAVIAQVVFKLQRTQRRNGLRERGNNAQSPARVVFELWSSKERKKVSM